MPALSEQRLNFFSIWSYWHHLFLIDQHPFHLFVTTVMFLGTTFPYLQSTWFRQSGLTLSFMGGHVIQTWWISIVHLFHHKDSFWNGHVIQVGPVILSPRTFTELWRSSEALFTEVAWLCSMKNSNQQGPPYEMSQRMKPVQSQMMERLESWWQCLCPWIQPCLKLVYPYGLFSYVSQ